MNSSVLKLGVYLYQNRRVLGFSLFPTSNCQGRMLLNQGVVLG